MIEEGLDADWPAQVKAALEPFKQGHLIKRPPIFYSARLEHGIWSPSRALAAKGLNGDTVIELDPEQGPPYGMIVSQTCEIVEDRPQPHHPWVQMVPVYQCEPESKLLDRDFIASLRPPALDGDNWVADLRIEVPVEKSMLVDREPIDAFEGDEGYEALGVELGQRRGRPALHSVFHAILAGTMGEMKHGDKPGRKKARRVRKNVFKLKLKIESGSRLEPRAACLYILTLGPAGEETREWFGDWWDLAREVAKEAGLELLPNRWLDVKEREIELEAYETLIDVRNPLLS